MIETRAAELRAVVKDLIHAAHMAGIQRGKPVWDMDKWRPWIDEIEALGVKFDALLAAEVVTND